MITVCRGKPMSKEKTLIIIKPDAIRRKLIGEFIQKFEKLGLEIEAIKSVWPQTIQIRQHYSHLEPGVVDAIVSYFQNNSFPIVVMIVSGYNAIEACRKLIGATEPLKAAPGTIRGDYYTESYSNKEFAAIMNLIHASDSYDSFVKERVIWFS